MIFFSLFLFCEKIHQFAVSRKEIHQFNNDQQVREKRTAVDCGNMRWTEGADSENTDRIVMRNAAELVWQPGNETLRDNSCGSIIFRSHLELRRSGYEHKSNSCRDELRSFLELANPAKYHSARHGFPPKRHFASDLIWQSFFENLTMRFFKCVY